MKRSELADSVREFASSTFVKPARSGGKRIVKINAGTVHKGMGYKNRVPLVVTALETMKFRNDNQLRLVRKEGPGQSTTTTFVFELL